MSKTACIRLLHVDDEADHAELTADALEREDERFVVDTATSASDGRATLAEASYDCVISDYDMPGQDGIEFLEAVRDEHPEMPFILFTGKGSEAVASGAISAGVTDYLQKGAGLDTYTILANRVENAVQKRQAEDAHRRHLEAVEAAQEGIAILDEDRQFRYVNQACAELYGYTPEEMVGEHWELVYPDDELETVETEVEPALETDGHWHGTAAGLRADGGTFLGEWRVSATAHAEYVCTVQDTTERTRRERTLSALHDATRNLMEAPDVQTVAERAVETARTVLEQPINGMWLHDPDASVLRSVATTDTATTVLEEIPDYHEGESLSWQAFEDGKLRVYDNLHAEPGRLRDDTQIQSEIIIPLGDHGVMNIGSEEPATFSDADIFLTRILGSAVEAALDRAEREQQLRDQRAELQRQNDRLERFASVISHDLRNPLKVAETRLELVQQNADSPHLDSIGTALTRMKALIDDLLTAAREGREIDKTEPVGLGDVVDQCWKNVQTADATLTCDTERRIHADRSRLQQLLENLFGNAVEHSDDDVAVVVGELSHSTERGREQGFYVADDGSGIPEDQREDVFKPGYSSAADGTGFGLNIVQEVAAAHGWEVRVVDGETGGARFEVTGVTVEDD